MQRAQSYRVFDVAYLSTDAGYASTQHSDSIQPPSQSVVLDATVYKFSGSGTDLALQMEGSHDGRVWKTTGFSALTMSGTSEPDNGQLAVVDTDYAFLRMRATVTKGSALFSASLVFTHQ